MPKTFTIDDLGDDWPVDGDELGRLRRRLDDDPRPAPTAYDLVSLIAIPSTADYDPKEDDDH